MAEYIKIYWPPVAFIISLIFGIGVWVLAQVIMLNRMQEKLEGMEEKLKDFDERLKHVERSE